jgi:predicted nucleic acid-binding protein
VKAVLDASVLVGVLSATDAHHDAAVEWLRRCEKDSDGLLLPTSALAEILVGAHRRGTADVDRVNRLVSSGLVQPVPISDTVVRDAARLRAGDLRLSLPDAFVIATGRVTGAAQIVTADRRWARCDARVRMIT